MRLNSLLLDMTLLLDLLKKGQGIDVDFDNEFIPAEKRDALYSYKKKRTRILGNVEAHWLYIRMFRADCGSFIKELVEVLSLRTEMFYLCASSCADPRRMYEQCTEWRPTTVNSQEKDVALFEFTDFLSNWYFRLVVQRTKMDTGRGELFLPGMEYIYRAILTNDHIIVPKNRL